MVITHNVFATNPPYRWVINAKDEDGNIYTWHEEDDEIAYQYKIGDIVQPPKGYKLKK